MKKLYKPINNFAKILNLAILLLTCIVACMPEKTPIIKAKDGDPAENSNGIVDNGEVNVDGSTAVKLEISVTGEIVTVSVYSQNVNDLFGVAFDLDYDPEFLEYQRTTEGNFLKAGGETVMAAVLENNQPGKVVVGSSLIGKVEGVKKSGLIATISLEMKSIFNVDNINSIIKLENLHLINSTGQEIAFILNNGN